MTGESVPKALTGTSARLAGIAEQVLSLLGLIRWHPRNIARRYLQEAVVGGKILAGPFLGLTYVESSVGSALTPKLLGTYELELWPVIDEIRARPPELLIDIGAAEGYYAVGLAWCCPSVQVVAFESCRDGRTLLKQLGELNGVSSRVRVQGTCDVVALGEAIESASDCLVIIDAEGAELELLNPVRVPGLDSCRILVELHPQFQQDVIEEIAGRFSNTHWQRLIAQRDRAVDELPVGSVAKKLLGRWMILETCEFRPLQMYWLWLTPKYTSQRDEVC